MNTEDGKNLHWTSDINTELPIVLDKTGFGAMMPVTLMQKFYETASILSDRYSMHVERGGKIVSWSWK